MLVRFWIELICFVDYCVSENDDDNLVLGLCIDKVSCYGNFKVQLGVEEQKELSPFCILLCLTLEGKLVMFHVARYFLELFPCLLFCVNIMWFLLLSLSVFDLVFSSAGKSYYYPFVIVIYV